MAAGSVRGFDVLQHELEKARESLKDVDENIKKLTGRDPSENRIGSRRLSSGAMRGGRTVFSVARKDLVENAEQIGSQRRPLRNAFSRLGARPGDKLLHQDSGDEEELPNKPVVHSSVVAASMDSRSRTDNIKQLNKDERGRKRNQRMLGNLLVGTLLKFQDEAKSGQNVTQKRKQVEQKLEQKALAERDELRKERRQLFNDRRHQQAKMRRLEQKLALVEIHAEWEKETRKLGFFARTKTKPHIYFKPKKINAEVENKIRESAKDVEEMIAERKKKLENEIEDLMEQDEDVDEGSDKGGENKGSDEDGSETIMKDDEDSHGKQRDEKKERRHSDDRKYKERDSSRLIKESTEHNESKSKTAGEKRKRSKESYTRRKIRRDSDSQQENSSGMLGSEKEGWTGMETLPCHSKESLETNNRNRSSLKSGGDQGSGITCNLVEMSESGDNSDESETDERKQVAVNTESDEKQAKIRESLVEEDNEDK